MEDKEYVVIYHNEDITYCIGVFDNYCTALGVLYHKFNEGINFNINQEYKIEYKKEFELIDRDTGYFWEVKYKDSLNKCDFTETYYLLKNMQENIMEEIK